MHAFGKFRQVELLREKLSMKKGFPGIGAIYPFIVVLYEP